MAGGMKGRTHQPAADARARRNAGLDVQFGVDPATKTVRGSVLMAAASVDYTVTTLGQLTVVPTLPSESAERAEVNTRITSLNTQLTNLAATVNGLRAKLRTAGILEA